MSASVCVRDGVRCRAWCRQPRRQRQREDTDGREMILMRVHQRRVTRCEVLAACRLPLASAVFVFWGGGRGRLPVASHSSRGRLRA